MNSLIAGLKGENGSMRGLTGSGEPGLYSLLGGTAVEQDSQQLRLTGGPGQTSATSRIALAYRDVRLAAVAAGRSVPAAGSGSGSGSGSVGGGKPGSGGGLQKPGQAK